MKVAIYLLGLGLATSLFAEADYKVIKDYLGRYPVLQWNQNVSATGHLNIVADEQGVGYTLEVPKWATNGVPAKSMISPKGTTELVREGNTIRQTHDSAEGKIYIEYLIYDGFLIIQSIDCEGPICQGDKITLAAGKSFGDLIAPDKFFSDRVGSYTIHLAGGTKPKEFTKTAEIAVDVSQSLLLAPYCDPDETFCDPGYNIFPNDKTTVYRREISETHRIYDLFLETDSGPHYFRWEENGSDVTFKNLRYKTPDKVVCMEHEMTKN